MSQNFLLANPTNSPSGVSNHPNTHPLGSLPFTDTQRATVVQEDFTNKLTYTTSDTTGFKVTNLSGTQGTPVVGLVDGLGGIISIATSSGAQADSILTTQTKCFQPNETSRLWAYQKLQLADATNAQYTLGFKGTSYEVRLIKKTGGTRLYLRATTPNLATTDFDTGVDFVNATYIHVGFAFDYPHSKLGVYAGTSYTAIARVLTLDLFKDLGGVLTDELSNGIFGIQNAGTAQVNTMLSDYVTLGQGK